MKTKTIVYTGPRLNYNMQSPAVITFPRGLPITVNGALVNVLPSEEFEEFNPKKHRRPKEIKPILIRMPRSLTEGLAAIRGLQKVREFYPYSPLEALCVGNWDFLIPKIKDLKIIKSFDVRPGNYYKEFSCTVRQNSPAFGGGALYVKSMEFCFLLHLNLMYGDDQKKPTLLPCKAQRKWLTILNLGSKIGTVWKDIGNYLAEQEWPWEVKIIDKNDDLKKSYETISQSKYVISTGDTPLSALTAYLGIPLLAFVPDLQSVFIRQLDFFNQIKKHCVLYSSFAFHKDFEKIYTKLSKVIPCVLNGEDLPDVPPIREKINLKETVERGRTG